MPLIKRGARGTITMPAGLARKTANGDTPIIFVATVHGQIIRMDSVSVVPGCFVPDNI